MLEWGDLRIFLAVHRSRSHAGAARALQVAATTVGRRLLALEEGVGARLFTRTPDGLAPTAAAAALLGHAERVEAEVLEAERALTAADERPTGTVRITTGDGFASFVLCPALPAFLAAHPGLSLDVQATVKVLDLSRGEADIALRNVRPRERSLVARRLGPERLGLYASPAYLARRGTPRSQADLAGHDLVLYHREYDRVATQAWLRQVGAAARAPLRCSSTTLMHAAIAAGAGIGLLTTAFVKDDARFVRVLPSLATPDGEIWAVTHQDLRGAARVVAVLRWLEGLVREAG